MLIHKPLWEEGILLSSQHFQQQNNYYHFVMNALSKLCHEFAWGVANIAIDEQFLLQEKLKIEHISLLFPDGTWLDTVSSQNPLPARSLMNIPPHTQTILVYLAIPHWQEQRSNLLEENEDFSFPKRFIREYRIVQNKFGDGNTEIAVESLNLQIKFDFEHCEDYVLCPIMRLTRNEQGHFQVDSSYVPPSLFIANSKPLYALLQRISDLLVTRQQNLSARKRARQNNVADLSSSDANLFWFLHSINSICPEFLHLERFPSRHPEKLYILLSKLLGMLNTFTIQDDLINIEAYNHLDLYPLFLRMEKQIRNLLDLVIPSPVVQIDLEQIKSTQWKAQFYDQRIDDKVELYLAVQSSSISIEALQHTLPLVAKVGSAEVIERVINTAVKGIPLQYMGNIPPGLPFRMDQAYFKLNNQHDDFKKMMVERSCSIYMPSTLDVQQIYLYAVVNV